MKKILIAEDDFFIRDVYDEIFKLNGYEVEVAADGHDALAKIKSQAFDVIMLDIKMPKASGIDILSQARGLDTPNKITPIFIITNLVEENVIKQAFNLGIDGYIIKSQVNPQQIVDEINKFLKDKKNLPTQ